jgi:hypothetical protein
MSDFLVGVLVWATILGVAAFTFSLPALWYLEFEKELKDRREEFNKRFGN